MDKRYALTQARRSEGRRATANAAAHHHHVVLAGIDGLFGQATQRLTPRSAGVVDCVRRRRKAPAQEDRVAAALKPSQVMQNQAQVALLKCDLASGLPGPRIAVCAELCRERYVADGQCKPSRRVRRSPIPRPNPDLVPTRLDASDGRGCVGDGPAEAMGQ